MCFNRPLASTIIWNSRQHPVNIGWLRKRYLVILLYLLVSQIISLAKRSLQQHAIYDILPFLACIPNCVNLNASFFLKVGDLDSHLSLAETGLCWNSEELAGTLENIRRCIVSWLDVITFVIKLMTNRITMLIKLMTNVDRDHVQEGFFIGQCSGGWATSTQEWRLLKPTSPWSR